MNIHTCLKFEVLNLNMAYITVFNIIRHYHENANFLVYIGIAGTLQN